MVVFAVVTAAVMLFFVVVVMVFTVVTTAVMLFLVVVMVVFTVVATAAMMFFALMVMVVFLLQLCQVSSNSSFTFHRFHDLRAGELIPGSGYDGGFFVMLTEHSHGSIQLLLRNAIGTGQDDGTGGFDLVIIELTKVLHIHFYLAGIHHGNSTVQHHIVVSNLLHCRNHIGQLAYAGGFDDDTVGVILGDHLSQGLTKVTHQAAADAAGIHLGDVDAGILQESAVNADLAKLVLNENQLLTCVALGDHFLDQGGFTGTQEAGVYIDFCHLSSHFPLKFST